jgi:hypothetical protein
MDIVELVRIVLSPPVLITVVAIVCVPSIAYVYTQRLKYRTELLLQKEKDAEILKHLNNRVEVLESIIINLEKDLMLAKRSLDENNAEKTKQILEQLQKS